MEYFDIIRIVLEAIFGGAFIVTLVTLRSTRRKAAEEARTAAIINDKALLDNFNEYIVEPLKKDVDDLRSDIQRLKHAIEQTKNCNLYRSPADCPVIHELQVAQGGGKEPDADKLIDTDAV